MYIWSCHDAVATIPGIGGVLSSSGLYLSNAKEFKRIEGDYSLS